MLELMGMDDVIAGGEKERVLGGWWAGLNRGGPG